MRCTRSPRRNTPPWRKPSPGWSEERMAALCRARVTVVTVFNTKGFDRGRDRPRWARPTFRRWQTKPATLYPVQHTEKGALRQPEGPACQGLAHLSDPSWKPLPRRLPSLCRTTAIWKRPTTPWSWMKTAFSPVFTTRRTAARCFKSGQKGNLMRDVRGQAHLLR